MSGLPGSAELFLGLLCTSNQGIVKKIGRSFVRHSTVLQICLSRHWSCWTPGWCLEEMNQFVMIRDVAFQRRCFLLWGIMAHIWFHISRAGWRGGVGRCVSAGSMSRDEGRDEIKSISVNSVLLLKLLTVWESVWFLLSVPPIMALSLVLSLCKITEKAVWQCYTSQGRRDTKHN